MLTKQHGNMYSFVTHTWNPIKGKCIHDCSYCYMKVFPQKEIRLVESELETDLGHHNYIFVGSGTDMWAKDVPAKWIETVLFLCKSYPENTYLFQSKNPLRFKMFDLPANAIFATTLETNRDYPESIGKAPSVNHRFAEFASWDYPHLTVTIEPIMDFDLEEFVEMIMAISPEFVSIGADSKNHHLPEPSGEKVKELIKELATFTEVKQKENLRRLLK